MSFVLLTFSFVNAQTAINLSGKIFHQVDDIPNSTTEIKFISNTQILFVMTNLIGGKTYIDECPGKSAVSGIKRRINKNKILII